MPGNSDPYLERINFENGILKVDAAFSLSLLLSSSVAPLSLRQPLAEGLALAVGDKGTVRRRTATLALLANG